MPETHFLPRVYLAAPYYGQVEAHTIPGLINSSSIAHVELRLGGCSLLANGFNRAWCNALNGREHMGYTHFAMNHADVAAPPGWLDILIEELEAENADVVSAVIPIKDDRGLTSTGVCGPQHQGVRRLSMHEIMQLPETFSLEDVRKFDSDPRWNFLAINTGLWVCRFDESWVEEFPGFEIRDRIDRLPSGEFTASVLSEDWNFSAWLAQMGKHVVATRKVALQHWGGVGYRNDEEWGTCQRDHTYTPTPVLEPGTVFKIG